MHFKSLCRQYGLYLILLGGGLMPLALFLHPMSPENFLALIVSRPWESLGESYGMRAALLFWAGLAAGMAGAAACLYSFFPPYAARRQVHVLTAVDDAYKDANHEDVERSWSFM